VLNSDIEEINIDTDEGDQFASDYNIRSLPTILILDDNGKEIERLVNTKEILNRYG
jgi:thioredoxin-related protein